MPDPHTSRAASPRPVGTDLWHFDCALTQADQDTAWIRVDGELDIATSPRLDRTVRQALEGARLVIVDLRGLTLMDSTGIHLFLRADTRARRSGRRLVLVRGLAQVDRLFELLGISHRLDVVDLTDVEPVAGTLTSCPPRDAA